jgi:hypothetical protein
MQQQLNKAQVKQHHTNIKQVRTGVRHRMDGKNGKEYSKRR